MLKVDEIIYPITFDSYGVGKFKFTSRSNGFKTDLLGREVKYNGSVDHFVAQNNRFNPNNSPAKDYYYTMAEKKENNPGGYFFAKNGEMIIGNAYISSGIISTTSETICKIEDVPIGATIKGIKRNAEGWDDVTFTPRRIEIHDDMITLLSGYAGGYSKDGNNYALEINIKRGTKVKYSTNC